MSDTEIEVLDPNQAQKLTGWAKEPSVINLREDFDAAKPFHDNQLTKINRWNNLRDITGGEKMKKVKGRSNVQPKLIRRQAEWRYSALSEPFLGDEKLFKVSPRTFEDVECSTQNELVLNWQFSTKINKVKFIDEYIRTTVDEGTSIVRLGWVRETESITVSVPTFQHYAITSEEEAQALMDAVELETQNPRMFNKIPEEIQAAVKYFKETGQPSTAIISGSTEVQEEKIIENKPTVQIMNPDNVYLDPSCEGDPDKAGFVVISYETSKAELLKDGRFKNLKSVNWEGNTVLSQPDHATETEDSFNFKDSLRKKIVAYEYWGNYDIHGNDKLVPIVATWIGNVMVRMEENPFPDKKHPFVFVPYLPVKREAYGEPDGEILEDNQKVLGAVTRGMIDLMGRSANSQQGFAKGFLDVTNRRKFENGQDYEFNPGTDPSRAIFQHTYPEIPNSALTVMQLQNQEAEAMSGVKSFAGGVSGEGYGDVAAGIRGVLDASSKREMNILRRLAKGMQDIGRKVSAMNAVFMSKKEIVRVTNEEFVEIDRDELKGNFDLIVDISTAEVDEKKAQDLGFMLQTMGPSMNPDMVSMILSEIATLKRMPALAEQIKNYRPQPDPMEEQMKQLELQKVQKEIEKLDSEIAFNHARAQEASSETDLNNIEATENASGITHDRELQKNKAQAKGNQDLEVTKSLLNPIEFGKGKPDVASAIGFNELSKMMDRTPDNVNSITSKSFDPRLDPALNPNLNF